MSEQASAFLVDRIRRQQSITTEKALAKLTQEERRVSLLILIHTISGGPNVMVGGVGFAVQGNLLMESTSCRGGNDTSTAVKGKLVLRICYLPGACQTKDLWP